MGKGILKVEIALEFVFVSFFGRQLLEKEVPGDLRLFWDYFSIFFFGGDPWKRESGDLRLFWDYLSIFLGGNPWKRESGDLRLLCDYFFIFFGGNPWKRESGDLRLLWDYFYTFFWWQPLEKGVYFFSGTPGKIFIRFHQFSSDFSFFKKIKIFKKIYLS